uniref:Uncharacterized protein n=1 Tax=Arundo donax TaxID=35708 RepID=A0A0A9BT03_ARUDO
MKCLLCLAPGHPRWQRRLGSPE